MTKHLLVLITVVLLLASFSIAGAQQPLVSDEPIFVQTQELDNTVQGFIMSEGRVCNPRTMLC